MNAVPLCDAQQMGSGHAKPVEVVQKDSAGVAAKRLYEPDTQLRPALLAGRRGTPGAADGAGPSGEAQFAFPSGVCVGNGNVWGAKAATAFPVMNAPVLLVADLQNARVRKIDRNGTVATVAGAPAASPTAPAGSSEPQPAGGPAVQAQAQTHTQSSPSTGSSGGRVVDGPATSATFAQPVSVAVDSAANVYVCDTGAHCIRKITPAGEVSTFVGRGAIDTPLSPLLPVSSAATAADDEKKSGAVAALPAAPKAKDLSGTAATLWFPTAVCVDSDDNLYIADAGHFLVRKVATRPPLAAAAGAAGAVVNTNGSGAGVGGAAVGAVRTLCGNGEQGYRDGSPEDVMFGRLGGIAVDSKFNVYVTDYQHHTVRKIAPDGFTATLCGRRNVAGASDGAGFAAGSSAEATFAGPLGLCVDANDNLFVADSLNGVIRKVLTGSSTADVRTVHTSPVPGANAGGAATKTFDQPCGVCCYAGQLYVTDPTAHALYKIDFDTTASGGPDGAERACFRRVCT